MVRALDQAGREWPSGNAAHRSIVVGERLPVIGLTEKIREAKGLLNAAYDISAEIGGCASVERTLDVIADE